MKNKEPEIAYDRSKDVLYISFGPPSPAVATESRKGGSFVRTDPISGEIVGLTILDFKRRYLNGNKANT